MDFTIDYKYNDNIITDSEIVLENAEAKHLTVEVICSNKKDNNSFTMEYYGDNGIVITRNRCNLDIYIAKNKTNYTKYFTIICTHANDEEVSESLKIIQPKEGYTLSVSSSEISLKEEVDSSSNSGYIGDEMYYDDIDINVTVTGGSGKYRIVGINRCRVDNEEITTLPFDNGFIINKHPEKITIRNFGKPFIEDNDYYIIKIQHFDTRSIEEEIKIKYKKNTRNKKLKNSSVDKLSALPKQQYIKILDLKPIEIVEEDTKEVKEIQYAVRMLENTTNYTIEGMKLNTELPFTVTEDGKESDLMVSAHSSAYWCSIKIIQKYNDKGKIERKLIFKILNKPLLERKTMITVTVIDMPKVRTSFIITNKPS